jgi:hypothetical protein
VEISHIKYKEICETVYGTRKIPLITLWEIGSIVERGAAPFIGSLHVELQETLSKENTLFIGYGQTDNRDCPIRCDFLFIKNC